MPEKKKTTARKTTKKTEPKKNKESKDIKENKIITILSYLGILFIVPLLLKPNSKFAKFHAKQGLVLTISWMVAMVLYPVMGLGFLIHIAIVVLSIMGIVNVSEGEMKKLPVVGDLAEKFKF